MTTTENTSQATHTITRPGMKAIQAELIFASPNFYVFMIDGTERTLAAKDGKVKGFTVTRIAQTVSWADPR